MSKSTYIHFTQEQKERANNIDLEQYLLSRGEQLERSGKEMRLKSNHSITIKGNSWYDHGEEKGGYSIDFIKMFYGLDFPAAVSELIGEGGNELKRIVYVKKEEPPKLFELPTRNSNERRVFAYMTKHRGIDPSVLSVFIKKGLIYESVEVSKTSGNTFHNAVFVGFDKDGKPAHAHKRSIYSEGKRFMQNIECSKPEHSFHYLGGSDRLYVFEAPIDLLSFITMHKDSKWQKHNYVAMCGTSSLPVMELLTDNSQLSHVVLCADNDTAGNKAAERIQEMLCEKGLTVGRIAPEGKDFNEDLLSKNIIQPQTEQAACITMA